MNKYCVLLVLLCIFGNRHSYEVYAFHSQVRLSPIIFVPGDGGTQLRAKLNKSSSPHYICQKQSDWYSIWLNLDQLIPGAIDCWVDNIKLYYDNITRTTHNTPGVTISIPENGWGDPEIVEWIDPTRNKNGAYFKDIGDMLVKEFNYVRLKNLHGAPYDFRKAPNEQKQFFIDLKQLVETSYERNDRTPVTFISHSMGSPMTLVFLQQQTYAWKKKYVKRIISLAGAWAGSIKAVKVFAMGDDLDALLLSADKLKAEQISCPSTAWLLPSPYFWKTNEVIIHAPNRDYTMSQLSNFFTDIDYQIGWEMRKDTLKYTLNFSPPDVELHCLYGDNMDTVEKLRYKKTPIVNEKPELIFGRGDGTVNRRSLEACQHWIGYQNESITYMSYSHVDHMGILANVNVLKYIKNVISKDL
ncbi:phospholipase A2 group XV-like [Teleopsis dalmanni]|uniref:phospholipase A2 group XV-like n=1 Tax=Teleopsis dalmanni TaxID=139649 RepID=UPI0018CFCC30|nr:phospholipase A2 group XV-like [Teleopsis dalmanni]